MQKEKVTSIWMSYLFPSKNLFSKEVQKKFLFFGEAKRKIRDIEFFSGSKKEKRNFEISFFLISFSRHRFFFSFSPFLERTTRKKNKKIFVFGRDFNQKFVQGRERVMMEREYTKGSLHLLGIKNRMDSNHLGRLVFDKREKGH